MEKGILHRLCSSIPIIGPALGIFIAHTEIGIAQFGMFLGLLRGVAVGLSIAVVLIAASEAAIAVFDVGRFWIEVHVTSQYKSAIGQEASRQAADAANRPYYERHKRDDSEPGPKVVPKPIFTEEPATPRRNQANVATNDCPVEGPVMPCFWLKLGKYEKLHYVLGVPDAVAGDHALWIELFRKECTFGCTVEQLDKFYANGAHSDVPVIDAMREVRGAQ